MATTHNITEEQVKKARAQKNGAQSFDGGESASMSKREYMATHIMAGFAAGDEIGGTIADQAEYAVKWADALLLELEN